MDDAGAVYITGSTRSRNFPVTPGAYQTAPPSATCLYYGFPAPCYNGFVSKFLPSTSGSFALSYSTRLGQPPDLYTSGDTFANSVAVDQFGSAYITGSTRSPQFPATPGAIQTATTHAYYGTAFVTKLAVDGSTLSYSTYLGGSGYGSEAGNAIAVDSTGNAYVAGSTSSSTFPTKDPVQATLGGGSDAFVAEINPSGSALIYSTFLGGKADDQGLAIAVDSYNNATVAGVTSSIDFPTRLPYQLVNGGSSDAFVAQLGPGRPTNGPVVLRVWPTQAGNAGSATIGLVGSGFSPAATASLICAGSTPLAGSNVAIAPDGTYLTVTFNLVGTQARQCDISVKNPDGTSITLPSSFTVEQGGAPDVSLSLVGRSVARGGQPQTYFVVLRNAGNVDSGPALTSILIPAFLQWQDSQDQPFFAVDNTSLSQALVVAVPNVPANGSIASPLLLTAPDSPVYAHQHFSIAAKQGTSIQLDDGTYVLNSFPLQPATRANLAASTDASYSAHATANKNPAASDTPFDTILAQKGCPFLPFSCPACNNSYVDELTRHTDSLLLYNQWQQARVDTDIALTNVVLKTTGAVASVIAVAAATDGLGTLLENAGLSTVEAAAAKAQINLILGSVRSLVQDAVLGRSDVVNALTGISTSLSVFSLKILAIEASVDSQPLKDPGGIIKTSLDRVQTGISAISSGLTAANATLDAFYNTRLLRDNSFASFNSSTVPYCQAQRAYQLCRDNSCGPQPPPPPPPPVSGPDSQINVEIITSGDPNDKVGNPGSGAARFLSGMPPMNYSIYFDNMPTATAPAQKVVVTDQLNASVVDLQTLTLGPISFVDKLVTSPATPLSVLGTYSTDVDLRPAKNLITRITAALNQSTGVLTWTYTSLDPSTMQPTTDPLAGFLPVGTEGSVSFSVVPKTAATGTQITNKATIVFDVNPPIDTPVWLNTLDNTKPTSQVNPLPATETITTFPVSWIGSDIGAGIQDYTVYVSDNGGPATAWLSNTTSTQGLYPGLGGHTYSFYSIARDLVGNVENSKPSSEATTRVLVDTTPPVITPQLSGTLGNNGWYRGPVTVSWTVGDPESGIASSSGCKSTILTADTASTTLTCTAKNGAGLSASVSTTVKIDQTPPVISGMPAAGCTLWPVDQKLVAVATVTAADVLSGLAPGTFKITGTSNEPILATDPKYPDIVITPNGTGGFVVQLRADRLGSSSDRIYTLTGVANDLAGNAVTRTARCVVPHDQSN
jgi:Beta-propeller repeat